jgi:hypothetical protein
MLSPPGHYPQRWVSFALSASDQNGTPIVRLGEAGKPFLINFDDPSQSGEFYESLVEKIKRSFREPKKAGTETIGFQISQLADNEK